MLRLAVKAEISSLHGGRQRSSRLVAGVRHERPDVRVAAAVSGVLLVVVVVMARFQLLALFIVGITGSQ